MRLPRRSAPRNDRVRIERRLPRFARNDREWKSAMTKRKILLKGKGGFFCNRRVNSLFVESKRTYSASSFASASICTLLVSFNAEVIVTVFSANVTFLELANFSFIIFAAIGAHEPFSIKPIFLF